MNRLFLRVVSLLLAPCLLLEPVLADFKVIPVKTGIHGVDAIMDSRMRGNDNLEAAFASEALNLPEVEIRSTPLSVEDTSRVDHETSNLVRGDSAQSLLAVRLMTAIAIIATVRRRIRQTLSASGSRGPGRATQSSKRGMSGRRGGTNGGDGSDGRPPASQQASNSAVGESPNAFLDIPDIARANEALNRLAQLHGWTIETEPGSTFFVFRIPQTGECLKCFYRGPDNDSLHALDMAQQYLGDLETPSLSVDIDKEGRIVLPPGRKNGRYIIQKLVSGPTVWDQIQQELGKKRPDPAKIFGLIERVVNWHARLLAAGMFDIDHNRILENLRGEGDITGFDLSHLRDTFGQVNVFGERGYADDWEESFSHLIDYLRHKDKRLDALLQDRFAGFSWRAEMANRHATIPAKPSQRQGTPMQRWVPNLVKLSASDSQTPGKPDMSKVYAVTLAGGKGTRLFPFDKPFSKLVGDRSFLQWAFYRACAVLKSSENWKTFITRDRFYVLTGKDKVKTVRSQLNIPARQILTDPHRRGTWPAILWAMANVRRQDHDATIAVLTSDHHIPDDDGFREAAATAIAAAQSRSAMVMIGIPPSADPEEWTDFGAVHTNEAGQYAGFLRSVDQFDEKPAKKRARKMIKQRDWYWNSGMFFFRLTTAENALAMYQPEMFKIYIAMAKAVEAGDMAAAEALFEKFPSKIPHPQDPEHLVDNSMDYALLMPMTLRPVNNLETFAVTKFPDWRDIGLWITMDDVLPDDGHGNVLIGKAKAKGSTKNSILAADTGSRIKATDVKDLIVARSGQTVLVLPKSRSRDLREIVNQLQASVPPRVPQDCVNCTLNPGTGQIIAVGVSDLEITIDGPTTRVRAKAAGRGKPAGDGSTIPTKPAASETKSGSREKAASHRRFSGFAGGKVGMLIPFIVGLMMATLVRAAEIPVTGATLAAEQTIRSVLAPQQKPPQNRALNTST